MKMTALTASLLVLALAACDKGPKTEAQGAPKATATTKDNVDGTKLGAGVKLAQSTPIDAILANPAQFNGKPIRVEGTITDVCEMRGCWMQLAGEKPGQTLRFKVVDGEMVFPMESKGKWAVAEGVFSTTELTLEQTKEHAAEEAREHGEKFDPASITKPTVIARIDGTGAVIRDKK